MSQFTTRSLHAGDFQRIKIMHSYQSLTSSTGSHYPLTTFPSSYRRPSIEVQDQYQCPNIRCNIPFRHKYTDLHPFLPRPPHIPELYIRRFASNMHPCPQTNSWQLKIKPSFEVVEGAVVYLELYGVVKLKEKAVGSLEWRCFLGVDESLRVVVEFWVMKEWIQPAARQREKYWLSSIFCGLF
jgi:hypothetical protein